MQPLLLLHGAIGAKDQLLPLADILKSKYEIHTLNFSGHGGKAFAREDFSIPFFAAEVFNYIEENKITKANVFGYSMGGYAGMCLAKHNQSMVRNLITLGTKFYWDEGVAAKEVGMLEADTILQKIPVFAGQLQKRHHPNDWKTVLAKTKEMLLQLGRQNTLQTGDYTTIHTPCLLLLGDRDKMVTVEETVAVQKVLPDAEFRLLPGTPHPIEQVDHQMLASIIDEFIADNP